jgi:SAM-dependent methyltransferase
MWIRVADACGGRGLWASCPAMTCRICRNDRNNRGFTAREMMFGFRDRFDYFECATCGCVQIAEIPPDLGKYYPKEYYSFQQAGLFKNWLKARWAAYSYGRLSFAGWCLSPVLGKNQAVEAVKRARIPQDAAILDVGCGSGDLLLLLRSLGFQDLSGADPFVAGDVVYPNGVTVWKKNLAEITRKFDAVMLHHSFEHMTDPNATLSQAARLLNQAGTIIIRVPVAGSYAWKQYGANWVQLDAPRHIFLPTIRSMEILADAAGLKLAQVVHESNEFQFWGSEQYVRDIPLHDPRSLAPLSRQALARRTMRRYRARADELNARGEGDSVCFHLCNKT